MLVREISEKRVKLLQNPWTENTGKRGNFLINLEIKEKGALKCCSSNKINGYFSEKRVARYQTYQRKGSFFILIISLKRVPPEFFLDKQAYTFNQE